MHSYDRILIHSQKSLLKGLSLRAVLNAVKKQPVLLALIPVSTASVIWSKLCYVYSEANKVPCF